MVDIAGKLIEVGRVQSSIADVSVQAHFRSPGDGMECLSMNRDVWKPSVRRGRVSSRRAERRLVDVGLGIFFVDPLSELYLNDNLLSLLWRLGCACFSPFDNWRPTHEHNTWVGPDTAPHPVQIFDGLYAEHPLPVVLCTDKDMAAFFSGEETSKSFFGLSDRVVGKDTTNDRACVNRVTYHKDSGACLQREANTAIRVDGCEIFGTTASAKPTCV